MIVSNELNKHLIHRIRIFIDYWNFQISLSDDVENEQYTKWENVSKVILDYAENKLKQFIPCPLCLEGTNIYLSYNPITGSKQKRWAENVLGCMPGIFTIIKQQKKRKKTICAKCRSAITRCQHCNEELINYQEKGIDIAIATDMIRLAWENAYDSAILVSSDSDFIPAVQFLNQKGKKVIHAGFYPTGSNLRKECWMSLDLNNIKKEFFK